MIALCVDDEPLLLKALIRAVKKSEDITEFFAFDNENQALEWAKDHHFDIAFLDIQLHNMTGLQLAQKLIEFEPLLSVIFCTGFPEYAIDAIEMHIDCGYLVKPVQYTKMQAEIDRIKAQKGKHNKILKAQCFGDFEVFYQDVPVKFKRSKSKELLAYLIDRRGAGVSAREICARLWEDSEPEDENTEQKKMNYLYQIVADMKKDLAQIHAENILIASKGNYSVDIRQIDCDFYRFLEGDRQAQKSFNGEYMTRYSWAEETCGWITAKINY